jgi:hypothetical protein
MNSHTHIFAKRVALVAPSMLAADCSARNVDWVSTLAARHATRGGEYVT